MPGLEGTSLGRYYLKHRLGYGGMSEVYLAYDDGLNRDVAIKVVSSTHDDYLERFKREARAIGSLDHEHILPAFDSGEQGPWHYLVMPYIEHNTLRERLERGRLTLEEAGELLLQIADALEYAHENGIIHRDIKPSNILMRDDHYTYLADFGLAKTMEGTNNLTQTGMLLGTPEYMAPELADGPATTSSDIYALAILLYQMVTGRVPFEADTPMAVYFKQLRDKPLPPSHINPAIPPAVEQVILRALEKDPRRRYQTANALAHAYIQALAGSSYADEIAPFEDASDRYATEEIAEPVYIQQVPLAVESAYLAAQPVVQEERLVLPADPGQAPSAIPSGRGGRSGSRITLRRNRAGVTPRIVTTGDSFPPAQQSFRQTPQGLAGSTPSYPAAPRRRSQYGQRMRTGNNRYLITGLMGASLVLVLVALVIFALANHGSASPAVPQPTSTSQVGTPAATQALGSTQATATAHTQSRQQAAYATATAVTAGTPVLQDALSSNTNGRWPNDGTSCAFINGTYHVLVKSANFLKPCELSSPSFDNAAMQVDVSLLSGNDAGLIFRANNDKFYDFEINNQGQFFFRRHDAGAGVQYVYLVQNTSNSAIATSGQKNTLLVIANGGDFQLFINGTFVGEAQDNTYSSGQMGFVVGTLSPNTSGEGSFANLNIFSV